VGVYLAICQFFVAPKGMGLRANRATIIGMWAPMGLMGIGSLGPTLVQFTTQFIPMELAAFLGPVIGALAASAFPKQRSQTS
jgi:hypothetical protein